MRSGSWKLRAPAQKGLELLRELWELDSELRELDSELRELKIQTSRSWKSKAKGALLGAGLEEAIEQKVSLIPGSLGEAKKKPPPTLSPHLPPPTAPPHPHPPPPSH